MQELHSGMVCPNVADIAPRPLPPDARESWRTFLRSMFWIGINSFGGPVAQIGVMQQEAVERRKWLNDKQFIHLLNFAHILPGPEALEIAIHLGYLRRGVNGGIIAGLLFIWPGFLSLTVLAWVYTHYGQVEWVRGFLNGVRPVAVALIVWAAVRLARKTLTSLGALGLAALVFVLSFAFSVPFPMLLLGSGVLGLVLAKQSDVTVNKKWHTPLIATLLLLALGAGAWSSQSTSDRPSVTAVATKHAASRSSKIDRSLQRQMEIAWVNTKAALITFGGAYTVLPYLREQTVLHYRWLTDAQVVDGLALAETTPGPLISVGVFLSYLAGGLPGAVVGCFFLFLPSFLFVLIFGRHIERVERIPRARDFLWGISAATIGLILALSAHLMPASLNSIFALVLAMTALVALWLWKVNIALVVLFGGALGIARTYLLANH